MTGHDRFVLDPATPDQHGENARLRGMGPLVPVRVEGVRAWAATRYSTLLAVLSHPALSRDIRHWDPAARDGAPPGTAVMRIVTDPSMLNAEDAEHRRLRTPVARAFTPGRMRRLRPRVAAVTGELIDRLRRLPAGSPVDLRRDFAYPLPRQVICELIGIPAARQAELHALTDAVVQVGGGPDDTPARRDALHRLLGEIVSERRTDPGEDLITDLFTLPERDGSRLGAGEVFDTIHLLFIAGHVTTVNLITNGIRALLAHPDRLAPLRDGGCPWSAAVEETLRWDSPVAHFPMRYAVSDVEIDGVRLRAGEAVLACFASAGRDPRQYGDRADRFDPAHPTGGHLSFGYGRHFCLGAPLARLEAEVALPALFAAFPDMTPAEPLDRLPPLDTLLGNSVRALPVHLGPPAGDQPSRLTIT